MYKIIACIEHATVLRADIIDIILKSDLLLPVWCKFHVDSLFRSEDIEKEKGVLLAWVTVPCFLWKIWITRLLSLKIIT